MVAPCFVGAEDFYNRQAAINYAIDWSIDLGNCNDPKEKGCPEVWNPNYQSFKGNDCANFISQCLEAGGWEQTPSDKESKDQICSNGSLGDLANWFSVDCDNLLGWFCCDGSHSWINAHSFYKRFDREYVNVQLVRNLSQLSVGDVISFDYVDKDDNLIPDGRYDHTYIVTGKTNNDLLVTAHTRDRRNSSWTQILEENPDGIAAYWHVLDPSLGSVGIYWLGYETDENGNIIGDEITVGWGDVPGAVSYNIYIDAGIWLLAGRTDDSKITLTYTGYERIAISPVDIAGEEGLKFEIDLLGDEPPIILN